MRLTPLVAAALISISSATAVAAPAVPAEDRPAADPITALQAFTGNRLEVVRNGIGGTVSSLGGAAPLTPPDGRGAEEIAREFVDGVAPAYGLDERTSRLDQRGVRPLDDGGAAVRFDQQHNGVPVLGGQIVVRVDGAGRVRSTTGEVAPGLELDMKPSLPARKAAEIAQASVARSVDADPADLVAEPGEVLVFDPELVGVRGPQVTRLVWSIDVEDRTGLVVDRTVLVDAHDGQLVFSYSNLHEIDSLVCDNANTGRTSEAQATCGGALPVVRSDATATSATTDVEDAYVLAKASLAMYEDLGRSGIAGDGAPVKSTVRMCFSGYACPYANAFWTTDEQQMYYGAGYASADDVVAHELTHGVTEHESGLLYFGQSGAINESLSDVFGELLDRRFDPASGAGDDTGDTEWALGEDIPGLGAIRNLADPPLFNDPDRMGSELYHAVGSDLYGVHINSGVNNKAAALLMGGGTFNGVTVPAIGDEKTARIYYEAQTSILTPGSDYRDLFVGLPQACQNLVGTNGITTADCSAVVAAVTATEMDQVPANLVGALTADECPAGQVRATDVFVDDFETTDGRWTFTATADGTWEYSTDFAQSGTRSLHGPDPEGKIELYASTTSPITIPAGATFLTFDHQHWFESDFNSSNTPVAYWDGGFLDVSTDGGATFQDIATLPAGAGAVHGYSGTLRPAGQGNDNSRAGKPAFAGLTPGFTTTRYDLSSLAGQDVVLRFTVATDSWPATSAPGWWIDDLSVHTCIVPTEPAAPAAPTAVAGNRTVKLTWTAPATGGVPITGYVVTPSVGGVDQAPIETGSTATTFTVTGLTNWTAYEFTVAARNSVGLGAASAKSAPVTPRSVFVAVTPKRIFDTRPGESPDALRVVPKTPIVSTAPLQVRLTGLPGGVTPATGVGAVSLNVAVTNPAAGGYITVYPCANRRLVASVNFDAGQTVANAVIAPVSPSGDVCFFSSTSTDLVVDLNGWFPAGAGYTAIAPERVFDTRPGESPSALRAVPKVKVQPATPLEVQVSALPGGLTPASGLGAVSLNVAVTNPEAGGYVTVYPCANRRLVASVNFAAGQTVSNAVIAPVSASGRICFYSSATTDIVVDINGWFPTGSGLASIGPERVFDTRPGESPAALRVVPKTKVVPSTPLTVRLTGLPGGLTPASGVSAVSLNVAVTNPEAGGFITAYPCGTRELISSGNFAAGQTVSNAVIAPVSPTGDVCFYTSVPADVIVDINGWFAT